MHYLPALLLGLLVLCRSTEFYANILSCNFTGFIISSSVSLWNLQDFIHIKPRHLKTKVSSSFPFQWVFVISSFSPIALTRAPCASWTTNGKNEPACLAADFIEGIARFHWSVWCQLLALLFKIQGLRGSKRCLPPSLPTWVPSLGLTWWEEKTDSLKLPSDVHTCAMTGACSHTYT